MGSAAAGLAVGWIGLRALGSLNLQDLPRGADIRFDASTVAFTLAAGVVIGVLLGVFPTLAGVPTAPTTFLADEGCATTIGPGVRRLRRGLVVAQVAFAFVLLIGAGLLFASLRRCWRSTPGFVPITS
jgi:hypothetical protein